ncbi:MAG: aspartate/glutamate racemase family protein [Rhodoferax sp.]|nr:aspartate/glutamate racemase family protein [Rhodoferax sp.]
MTRLLLINPNTTDAVTELLATHARALAPAGAVLTTRTARFGASYISSETGVVLAAHAALDAWVLDVHQYRGDPPSAILIGCFGDPGIEALREISGCPVVGLASAALHEAARVGRWAVLTGGLPWVPILKRLAFSEGVGGNLAEVRAIAATGTQLAADPECARRMLRDACTELLHDHPGLQCIVLGGAALAGVAGDFQPGLPVVRLLDSVVCGVSAAWQAAAQAASKPMDTFSSATAAISRVSVRWTSFVPDSAAGDRLASELNRRGST